MNKNDWMVLNDSKIIKILDGDTSIGRIKINGKDISIKLLHLSGPKICDISYEIGFIHYFVIHSPLSFFY